MVKCHRTASFLLFLLSPTGLARSRLALVALHGGALLCVGAVSGESAAVPASAVSNTPSAAALNPRGGIEAEPTEAMPPLLAPAGVKRPALVPAAASPPRKKL